MPTADEWRPEFYLQTDLFAPIQNLAQRFSSKRFPSLLEMNQDLPSIQTLSGKKIRFVPQAGKPTLFHEHYEPRIYCFGEIQTRIDNWHDYFNMLVWRCFPQVKAMINAIHYNQALLHFAQNNNQRNTIQNRLTQFDECGVIVTSADPNLLTLLYEHRFAELFVQNRQAVLAKMNFFVFGHALYEKALNPYSGLTGPCVNFEVNPDFNFLPLNQKIKHINLLTADYLKKLALMKNIAKFTPLPVLGIPGWDQENENPEFYANKAYFRERVI